MTKRLKKKSTSEDSSAEQSVSSSQTESSKTSTQDEKGGGSISAATPEDKTEIGKSAPAESPKPVTMNSAANPPSVKPTLVQNPALTQSMPPALPTEVVPPKITLNNGMHLPPDLPLLSGKDLVLFPNTVMPIAVESEHDRQMLDRAMLEHRLIAITPLEREMHSPADVGALHRTVCVAMVHKLLRMPDGEMRVLVQGIQRAAIIGIAATSPGVRARVVPLNEIIVESLELQALFEGMKKLFARLSSMITFPEEVQVAAHNISMPGQFCDMAVNNIEISHTERLSIFDELNVNERCKKITLLLARYVQIVELSDRIQEDVAKKIGEGHKEYYLREQLKVIQKELGTEEGGEIEDLKKRIAEKNLPDEAAQESKRELDRLANMHPSSAEYTVARTYLDWILDVPWHERTTDNIRLKNAREILDRDHYNLKKIKERIIEFLAVKKIHPAGRSPILCLVGPPGVGKTSLGKSIADAMGRKFVRHSLGGVRDEAEIRGHRRTYVGAMPGRIIQGLKRAGVKNPVFMLDEIDKLANDFRGDPSSALLEALDPEQNSAFLDHYLDVPFDLSEVIFIATANQTDPIPDALFDRMEIIPLAGYSTYEKKWIARKHLLPRILRDHGLTPAQLHLQDAALQLLLRGYTREAGLRNLERNLAALTRKAVVKLQSGRQKKVTITVAEMRKMLGPPPFFGEVAGRANRPGIAIGLVWTAVGGGILFIESTMMRGGKNLQLTGSLGDVIKESAMASLSWIRAHVAELPVADDFYEANDYHVHFPEGATPKDGPSAGIALVASLVSLLVKKRVKPYLAMTGEITLRGKVLPVGGVKEKMIGAHLAGIKEVILPEQNKKDLDDLPAEVRRGIKFHLINEIRDMLPIAFPDFAKIKKFPAFLPPPTDASAPNATQNSPQKSR